MRRLPAGLAILSISAALSLALTIAIAPPRPLECGLATGYVGPDPEMQKAYPGGMYCLYEDGGWVPGEAPIEPPALFLAGWSGVGLVLVAIVWVRTLIASRRTQFGADPRQPRE
ncbi:MAG: hypothetical protein QOH59_809 [Gemmatimonadales bacterium]|jgi:hypothetical protein|nr:hypothetical protein [Gemmatimonadales bacterium]